MFRLTPIFGIDQGQPARHSIRLETVELRTRREVFVTGRVLAASRPWKGYFQWRELEQVDLVVDVDWRLWHFQFIPYLRPTPSIYYVNGREAPAWAGAGADDQLSYSSWQPDANQFNRRIILMHTLWPVGKCPYNSLGELEGKVLEMPFFTVDAHEVSGEQITAAWNHDRLGSKSVKRGHEVTQCPWLLPQDAWEPFIDQQRRQAA